MEIYRSELLREWEMGKIPSLTTINTERGDSKSALVGEGREYFAVVEFKVLRTLWLLPHSFKKIYMLGYKGQITTS